MICCGNEAVSVGNGYFKCAICKGTLHDFVFKGGTIGEEAYRKAMGFPEKTIQERIIELLTKQTEKGLSKYGHTLDDCPDDKFDWRLMAMEELIDLAQYQQKEIMRLERLLNP